MKLRITPNAFSSLSSPGTVGLIMGFAAAICYGFIPTFTLPLRPDAAAVHAGLSDLSILFYRFMSASVIIALLMIVKGEVVSHHARRTGHTHLSGLPLGRRGPLPAGGL
mgnify:CR=1 FL=1